MIATRTFRAAQQLPITPGQAATAIMAVVVLFRLVLAFSDSAHLGVDGGAYIIGMNAVLGDEPTGAGFKRPPLAPGWLLVPFVEFMGANAGFKAWSAVFSVVPILPAAYLLARMVLPPWYAVLALAFLGVDLWHSEMTVTGALPLVGFGWIYLTLWGILQRAKGNLSRWSALAISLGIPLTALSNQTSAGIAAIAIPVVTLVAFMSYGDGVVRRIGPWIFLGGVLALSAAPWYIDVRPDSPILRYPGPLLFMAGWSSSAYWQLIGSWVVGLIAWRSTSSPTVRALAALLITHGTLAPFFSSDETVINIFYRSRYFLVVPGWLVAIWVARAHWRRIKPAYRRATVAGIAALWVALAVGAVWAFDNQRNYATFITPDMAEVIERQTAHYEGGMTITTNFSQALWIAGLAKRPVLWTFTNEPPRAYTETDLNVRCVLNWVPGCDVASAAEAIDASWVLVDTKYPLPFGVSWDIYGAPFENPSDLWPVTSSAPWLELVAEEGTVKLWKVKG